MFGSEIVTSVPVGRLVDLALEEDLGRGDVTTEVMGLAERQVTGAVVARQPLVVCGLGVAERVFGRVDPSIELGWKAADGNQVSAGTRLLELRGRAATILQAERTALNFLMRMSGVATLARRYVDRVASSGAKARVVDTRKTLPGWRVLDKYAVRCGGGGNHRPDLGSGILIKDNHIAACGSVGEAVRRARKQAPHPLRIEVEVTNVDELDAALDAGAEIVLLDNMAPAQLADAVARVAGRALTEASGGVTEETLGSVAASGVDLISVGALTHSAPAADLALDFDVD